VNLRWIGFHVAGAGLCAAATLSPLPSYAQINGAVRASSASHISAEITKGRLNPAQSKPGDTVAIKLKDDVRSNGEVILKKGVIITGVVRSVRGADVKDEFNGHAQSMMEIEWLAPAMPGRAAGSLSFALQSVMQVNPIYLHEQSDLRSDGGSSSSAIVRPGRAGSSSGLLETVGASSGVAAGAISAISAGDSVASGAGTAASSASSSLAGGRSNVALLSMPSVVAVDRQTGLNIESRLGTSPSGQLFRVGHGELISAVGSKQSVDLYSHLSNDTVITSGRNFEIFSGAQIQMLVGVNRN